MKYIHQNKYDEKRLLEVINIENAVYDKKYCGTFESVSKRYKKNEEMFIFAVDEENKMCGYICFFPISRELTAKIENNLIMPDDNIQPQDVIKYDKNGVNNIFIISVAVLPEYKGKGIGFILAKEMFSFLSSQSVSGYEIGKIFALATSVEGEKVLSKFNFEKTHTYENKNSLLKCDFFCYKDMDLYLFFPVSLTSGFKKSKRINLFLKKLINTSRVEVNSLMNERLDRMYIGKIRFAAEDDEYGREVKTTVLEAKLYLSAYRDIGTLIMEFPFITYDPTFVLDQSSRNELKVVVDNVNNEKKPLYEYLSSYGINVLGNCTHLLVSGKNLNPYYRQFVLFAETYFNRLGSRIISKEAEIAASSNLAQYDFGEIYASGVGVIFELGLQKKRDYRLRLKLQNNYRLRLKPQDNYRLRLKPQGNYWLRLKQQSNYRLRLKISILMIFINEILALEIAALQLIQNAIVKEFDNSPKPSLAVIEKLIDSYGKYIVLFEYNYKYNLAKCLGDKVAQRFGIEKMRKDYEANVEQLNKIVTIRSERISKEFSKKQDMLFKIVSVFTLLLSINNFITLFVGVNFSNPISLAAFIVSIILWGAAIIYLLVIWLRRIIAKKRNKLK